MAPPFRRILEIKAPGGGADVAQRQALHDGAIGAHAMHALQHYGKKEPAYDGSTNTYSSTPARTRSSSLQLRDDA
ncbi:hypothetical protein VTI74DRAFT_6824 [Chaetomium olivicolor]